MTDLFKYVFIVALAVGLASCKDDLKLPDNTVQFESDQLGIASTESELVVNIAFARAVTEAGSITLDAELTGLEYGTQFTTEPAMTNNTITIEVASGATGVSFKVMKVDGVALLGSEQIKFTIQSSISSLIQGEKNALTLSFSEILAVKAIMNPNVGGDKEPNKVYVDLSGNRQYFLSRDKWDLGFYTAEGEFSVFLNSSSSMVAKALDKTDLNSVSDADIVGLDAQLSTAAIFAAVVNTPSGDPYPAWLSDAIHWIDEPNGDITKTAIAEVSATDSDNKVYIINRGTTPDGTERGWKKVRILRNGNGYTVQYADINATSFETISIVKDNAYLFNYINFDTGLVEAEPKKDLWDIAFTVFTDATPTGGPSDPVIPYVFLDVVLQNRFNVETAKVLTSAISYEAFAEGDIAAQTFSTSQLGIGSSWRKPGGPTSSPSLYEDRFYVIKDTDGNVYKLKFTALTQGGVRGEPQIQFDLVQQAN